MYSCSDDRTFHPEDAFVGYQSDTPASIVFKVWHDLKGADDNKEEVL